MATLTFSLKMERKGSRKYLGREIPLEDGR
jgi:hypothetical protein